MEFSHILPIESRLIPTHLISASFSFVIGKALSHLASSETPACLDEPTHEWIPTEPIPTPAYIKSGSWGLEKKVCLFFKNLFFCCQSEKNYVFYVQRPKK